MKRLNEEQVKEVCNQVEQSKKDEYNEIMNDIKTGQATVHVPKEVGNEKLQEQRQKGFNMLFYGMSGMIK